MLWSIDTAGAIGSSVSICSNDDPAAFTSSFPATAPVGANITYQWWVRSDGVHGQIQVLLELYMMQDHYQFLLHIKE